MAFVQDLVASGEFGDVYMLQGATSAFTNASLVASSGVNLPRVNYNFPANTLYKLSDRTKKVLDFTQPLSNFSVTNGGTAVSPTTYQFLPNGGYLYFPAGITATGGTNEVDTLTTTGATAGTLTVTVFGITTASINYNATTAQVNTAMQNAFGAANVAVTGAGPLTSGVTITWTASYGSMPIGVNAITLTQTAWTGTNAAVTQTTPGVSGLVLNGNCVPTTGASAPVRLSESKDWKITKNNATVNADVYGLGFGRDIPGIPRGTFAFTEMLVDNSLYFYQNANLPVTLALYETTRPQGPATPRIWIVQGYVTKTDADAPLAGIGKADISGTLVWWPQFISEAL